MDRKLEDIQKLLVCRSHLGTLNLNHDMRSYIYRKTSDGVHILNLGRTWEKIMVAARVIVAIENPEDILVISQRPYGSRAVLKFSQFVGSRSAPGRWTPGSLTNYITKKFTEPRLLIVTDPRTDSQAILEASYSSIPVIGLCDSDSPLAHIDLAIPCNNKGKESIALVYWLLAREVLYLRRGVLNRSQDWEVLPDSFFWMDPDEIQGEKEAGAWEDVPGSGAPAADQWQEATAAQGEWDVEGGDNWAGGAAEGW